MAFFVSLLVIHSSIRVEMASVVIHCFTQREKQEQLMAIAVTDGGGYMRCNVSNVSTGHANSSRHQVEKLK